MSIRVVASLKEREIMTASLGLLRKYVRRLHLNICQTQHGSGRRIIYVKVHGWLNTSSSLCITGYAQRKRDDA